MARRAATQHQPYQPGDLVVGGKYRVEELIGAGAFGQVYRVRHLVLDGARALKVIRKDAPGVGSTSFQGYRERLQLEFRLAERVKHRNVIAIYDLIDEPDALFAEMELAEGGTVAELLREEGRLSADRVVAILRDAARGLAALHKAGAVHRDVKPANLLLSADGTLKVSDLGLAQWAAGRGDAAGGSYDGSMMARQPGSVDYSSPEHDLLQPLRATSDVYGLGCVAFELLTGRKWKDVRYEVAGATELRPDVQPWLDALLRRMLADAPGIRPQDAADQEKRFVDMAGLLDALAAGVGATARKPEPAQDGPSPSLSRAVELMDAEAFAEAIAMLEALLAGGTAPRTVEALLTDAREAEAEEGRRREIRREYESISILARGKRTEHRALESWERFRAEYPTWAEDPNDLAAWADAHPLTVARRKAEFQDIYGRGGGSDFFEGLFGGRGKAEARHKAEAARLAAEAAAAARHAVPTATADQKRLLNLLRDPKVPVAERAAAGRKLAELGDPRPGVGLRPDGLPDIAWVDIPAGEFIMGSDDHGDDEKPRRSVTLGSSAIGMFPVTYAQYKAFLEAKDGYANPKWWSEPTKLAAREEQPGNQKWKFANHPAERVSWYDAVAFTRWLTARLRASRELQVGTEIRLPTEEEWERAARGTDGRMYPWGDTFKDGHANVIDGPAGQRLVELAGAEKARSGNWGDYWAEFKKETTVGIKRTTAVGCYPQGAAPSGLLDAAGNVWEWTLTEFASKDSSDPTNDRPRVARGGAWHSNPDLARASYRSHRRPDNRDDHVGFRVVEAAPVR